MPNMGIQAANASPTGPIGVADALFTQTQQRVLALLFGQDRRDFSISELISGSGAGSGAVQREVAKLVASGLVEQRKVGNQKRYRAFAGSPIHAELVALVHKTIGLAQPLREALVTRDRKQVFRVDDGIPVLLAEEAIPTAQIADFPAA